MGTARSSTAVRSAHLARLAAGALATGFLIPGLVLGATQTGAGSADKPAPPGFCAAMTKVADAAVKDSQHPSVANGEKTALALLAAERFAPARIAPAIAATESEYQEMWAQDVSGMLGYHGATSVTVSAKQATADRAAVGGYVTQECPSSAKPLETERHTSP
jgi:hypothetical protein